MGMAMSIRINPTKLVEEDPQFGRFLATVMQLLTKGDTEAWILKCYRAYQEGRLPEEVVEDVLGDNYAH